MSALALAPNEQNPTAIASVVRQLIEGRSNAVGSVTLTANAASTAKTAPACGPGAAVFLFPQTANAAAEVGNGTIYVAAAAVTARQFVITHANNAQTDRTFFFVCLG